MGKTLPLKPYQVEALARITDYAQKARQMGAKHAFYDITDDKYQPAPGTLAPTPYICIQIPTGGGKTLVAAHSVGEIFNSYLQREVGLVLWLVPWESILAQTLRALEDKTHPYHMVLASAFPGKGIRVLPLKDALTGQLRPHDLTDNLCIIVSTLDAFRVQDKEGRKVYAGNGNLMTHFEGLSPDIKARLWHDDSGEIPQSLENVIRIHNPLVVLDEGHNAQTDLSFDMLARFNPAFMLEYTATPRSQSNVLVRIPATALKQAEMVKLPLWLYNRSSWQHTLQDAKLKRDELQQLADTECAASGDCLRPILLIQAEPKSQDDPNRATVELVRAFLLNGLKIPLEQVAVKTGEQDDLKGVDLFAPGCPICYIITVYALKEGWDCSFAYVLASVASMGQTLAVEQLIGRVLRLPGAKRKQNEFLNYAYVYSCAPSFNQAAQAVQAGLQGNGYAPEDVRKAPDSGPPSLAVERAVEDQGAAIPLLAYQQGSTWERLEFSHLLTGFSLPKCDPTITFTPPQEDQFAKLDVKQEGGSTGKEQIHVDYEDEKPKQLALPWAIHDAPLDTAALVMWLDRQLPNPYISQQDNRTFFRQVIENLVLTQNQGLADLTRHRFHLRAVLKAHVMSLLDEYAHQKLLEYKKTSALMASGQALFHLPPNITLDRPHKSTFARHLFAQAAPMNAEEAGLAVKLDGLDDLLWWYRNRENQDFFLQGWWGQFYPDFIARTKSGLMLILEYKGSQLAGGPDAQRKEELGQIWEDVSGGQGRFWMIETSNMNAAIAEIKGL